MAAPPWIQTLFQAFDTFDTDTAASFLNDDAILVLGNADPLKGKITIRDALAAFFTTIAAIRHDLIETWTVPGAIICQGTVTYTRHNGTQLQVPFVDVFKLKNERIQEFSVYVDSTQL